MGAFLERLSLTDYRSYAQLDLELVAGRIGFIGPNGVGKTNILEAACWLATGQSFRGAPNAALVRVGAERGFVRGTWQRDGRGTDLNVEIPARGPARVLVNGKRLPRLRDLLGHLRVTVFSPDDLAIVKGPPAERRLFVDNLLIALDPRNDRLLTDFERVLRHRSTLLRDCGGRLDREAEASLDVWDAKLAPLADALGRARHECVADLERLVRATYRALVVRSPHEATPQEIGLSYRPEWAAAPFAATLERVRQDDVRRGTTTTGPHRDDIDLTLDGQPSRTHRSQGEQRSMALALRLAEYHLIEASLGVPPLLVLDDVFSELDHARSAALVGHLPRGQALISSATELPNDVQIEQRFDVLPGSVRPRGAA